MIAILLPSVLNFLISGHKCIGQVHLGHRDQMCSLQLYLRGVFIFSFQTFFLRLKWNLPFYLWILLIEIFFLGILGEDYCIFLLVSGSNFLLLQWFKWSFASLQQKRIYSHEFYIMKFYCWCWFLGLPHTWRTLGIKPRTPYDISSVCCTWNFADFRYPLVYIVYKVNTIIRVSRITKAKKKSCNIFLQANKGMFSLKYLMILKTRPNATEPDLSNPLSPLIFSSTGCCRSLFLHWLYQNIGCLW